MHATHAIASGMGGMRTAGDLVARMQMSRGMRIDEAKKCVADKLGISVSEVCDPVVMSEVREEGGDEGGDEVREEMREEGMR